MSMEVLSPRTTLLSNFEVLHLLREYESEQLARQKTALRIKKEEEERERLGLTSGSGSGRPQLDPVDANANPNVSLVNPNPNFQVQEEVCENLRTVEFEAIQYLSADYLPTKRYQSTESVASLVKNLNKYSLTKAEKLQIVNLAPVEAVELYVIVEEIEDRFREEQMEEILSLVRSSLSTESEFTSPLFLPSTAVDQDRLDSLGESESRSRPSNLDTDRVNRPGWEDGHAHGEQEQEQAGEEMEFDDFGAGAGVEGDLEMGDENDD